MDAIARNGHVVAREQTSATLPVRYGIERLMTLTESAAVLRCSKAHLCNILNGRVPGVPKLPHVVLGRRKLIRLGSLEEWIAKAEAHQL